ncbi:site-2 protease family protein [Lewinella sp. 4G2]|uniref:site-2 protease family protein n=1 Tax=Lewinella sp. 4G2 TaxID=1803372 RepID=UPI0007B4AF3A|nr:site-2 protease family protein [Lewinella sp. 4G2]OAV43033.1 hypothetical protein A3850_000300 [Lewinella sp. 4G2]
MDLHWSFVLVVPGILYLSYQPEVGIVREALTWYLSVGVLLFLFVLLHELGHALMARARDVTAEKIVLFPLGGGAFLPDPPKTVVDELLIYGAGPGANLLLAAIALPFLYFQPDGDLLLRSFVDPFGNYVVQPDRMDQLLGVSVAVNLILAIGNLLPAYPLDGGRMLRALLRRPLGERPAVVVVTLLGMLIGISLLGLAWYLKDPLLAFGALFIAGTSAVTYRSGWQRRRLSKKTVSAVVRAIDDLPIKSRLYAGDATTKAHRIFSVTNWPVLPVYDGWNALRGFVSRETLEDEDPATEGSVLDIAEFEFVTAAPGDNLLEVTEKIVAANVYGAAVYGNRGRILGFVFTEDIMELLGKGNRRR